MLQRYMLITRPITGDSKEIDMKRFKGFAELGILLMVLVFGGIVGNHVAKGEKAPETPAVHNYNK